VTEDLPPIDPVYVNQRLRDEIDAEIPLPQPTQHPADIDQSIYIDQKCKACEVNNVNSASIPCGHAMMCMTCAGINRQLYGVCSYCKQPITGIFYIRGTAPRNDPIMVNERPERIDKSTQTEPIQKMPIFD